MTTEIFGEVLTSAGDGISFDLLHKPTPATIRLYLNGLRQRKTSDFLVVGNRITLLDALPGAVATADYETEEL